MAPGRKRGGKGLKTKNELSLGDLVLAKVKGFPAWPAKISRPEDWDRAPDPKKYFVQFFGTSEIAFVAPADIQAFTSESKNKLSARCQGKTVRHFAQAVKEICEEFELLQCKNLSSIRDDSNAQNLASERDAVQPVVGANDGVDTERSNCKLEIKGLSDLGSGLDNFSERQGEMECEDVKPCSSNDVNDSLSPHLSLGKRNKLSTSTTNLVKGSVLGSSPSSQEFVMDEASRDVKARSTDGGHSELTNGHQPKPAMGPKRKHEGTMGRNSGTVRSHEHAGDGLGQKFASDGKMKVSSADNSKLGVSIGSERKGKKLLKVRKHSEAVGDGRVEAEINFEEHDEVITKKKMKFQHDHEKQTSYTNEASFPARMSKCADSLDDPSKLISQRSKNNDSRSPVDLDYKMDNVESKRSTSGGKAENHRPLKVQTNTNESDDSTDEDDLPPMKRHRRPVMSSSVLTSENRAGNSASRKNGLVQPDKVESPVKQQATKRRAVRMCDDDDDELPKTPIHGGFTYKVSVIPRISDSNRKNVKHGERDANDQPVLKKSGIVDIALKERVQSSGVFNKASPSTAQQCMEKRNRGSSAEHVSPSPSLLNSEKSPFMEAKPAVVSPKRSPRSITASKSLTEPQKKHFSKAPNSTSQKKIPSGLNRGILAASDQSASSLNQSISDKSKPTSSGEKMKTSLKSESQIIDSVALGENPDDSITSLSERLDVGKDTKTSYPVDLKIPDSSKSMKHLIAAAQARKREAHLQNSYGNPLSLLVPDAEMLGRSPSTTPATLAVESNNTTQVDIQRLHPTSLPSDVRQFSSTNEHDNEEIEETRASSGHQATGSSLSGGTEAAVARDAFEGMIETLSRTKESIGRATRLAIDCAKYGIANEVVEVLIRKLESEPSFHRRVDLFFLVDSITQCSHSQKGIAGASYIPIVQAALPRLIGAAAPPGAGAQENRRQCHKVLRLWLERKILPESVLRRYMNDIGAVNDDTSVGLSLRRPSRSERAIDDPIREMEGMFVDEYGSNATFQLPGFLSSHVFEEEEDEDEDNFPTKLCKEESDTSLPEQAPAGKDPENYTVTPSDRRHCILEDVDGELEMEDVSGHEKDERPLFANGTSEVASLEPNSDKTFESASNMFEFLPSPEGSPPLPPGSPPVTPPLPTSPPSSSPPPPPPPLSSPSPPPPPPSSQQHLFPPPLVEPPPFLSQQSLPPQAALMSQQMPRPPSTISTSQPFPYHPPPLPHEVGGTPTFFPPAGVSNAQEQAGYNSSRLVEYGQGDPYMNPQASQPRQPFLPGSAPFAQRPLHPEPPPQRTPSQFYPNSGQQRQYAPYSTPNFADVPRRYATDEQWRMQGNEFNADCPRGGWITGGRSGSGPPYSHEGYFGPTPERPPASATNFQPSAANSLPAGPTSVHGVPMMPDRPDMSAINWRPA